MTEEQYNWNDFQKEVMNEAMAEARNMLQNAKPNIAGAITLEIGYPNDLAIEVAATLKMKAENFLNRMIFRSVQFQELNEYSTEQQKKMLKNIVMDCAWHAAIRVEQAMTQSIMENMKTTLAPHALIDDGRFISEGTLIIQSPMIPKGCVLVNEDDYFDIKTRYGDEGKGKSNTWHKEPENQIRPDYGHLKNKEGEQHDKEKQDMGN
jgi:hypothetical protein